METDGKNRSAAPEGGSGAEGPFMVGEYVADYGPLPLPDELATPEADGIIARSRTVSQRRL